jgi:ankyrin repeat protein
LEVAQLLLDYGADPNAEDNNGWGSLHSALRRGDLKLVQLLLKCSANMYIQNDTNQAPLHEAAEGDNVIMELLYRQFDVATST